jgi:hypothetical protein
MGTGQFGARRMAGLAILAVAAGGFITYMSLAVPVKASLLTPRLTRSQISAHWLVAAIGLLIVVAVDAAIIWICLRSSRSERSHALSADDRGTVESTVSRRGGSGFPAELGIQSVPGWILAVTALISGGVFAGAKYLHLPLWEMVLGTLMLWIPLLAFEGVWKYKHYGVYALLFGLALLQVGHVGEHMAQVTQLMMYHGDASRAHGVFGQLDFELVHFVWDGLVWLLSGFLVWRLRHNKWLWISWLVASFHQVEHIYLFWLNRFHFVFWARGGMAGILARGGLIGSPLNRPYLHFLYNLFVVVPMLVALWDQTKDLYDHRLSTALAELPEVHAPTLRRLPQPAYLGA